MMQKMLQAGSPKRAIIFDCFSGLSGDMTVGAFLDLGMDFSFLKRELKKIALSGYNLSKRTVKRGALAGTQFLVRVKKKSDHAERTVTYKAIKTLLDASDLDRDVVALSKRIFASLAAAEAHIHGTKTDALHFHEIGAIDSVIDIVATALCLHYFNIQHVYAKNIHIGSGCMPASAHGTFPVPAPATIKLLKGFPITFTDIPHELITPTGASFLATLVEPGRAVPSVIVERIGYGAGTNVFKERPNFLRLLIGTLQQVSSEETLCLLEANIDDMPPFVYEEVFAKLFVCGARDVFLTPILMKKNRPAHTLSVLFGQSIEKKILEIIFRETSTIGVRFHTVRRVILPRKKATVVTPFGAVKIKISELPQGTHRAYPEYESCKEVARKKKVPLLTVYQAAQQAAHAYVEKKKHVIR